MTTLVLGAVGGVVGGFFGGPVGAQVGFLLGTLAGSLIDPPKIVGPHLGDTKLQRSTYGANLPYAWGSGRIGTIVIDQTDLVEHEETTGGKGGPQQTNFTYSASWLAALCVRLPNRDAAIAGISHLFMDGRLVWAADSDGDCPCEVYTGTETQTPDADFEAINGVGKQPAYRGLAYLKFKDFPLADYGNRIPNVEAVVFTVGVASGFPTRVAEFRPWDLTNTQGYTSTYTNGLVTVTWTYRDGTVFTIWWAQYKLNGTVVTPAAQIFTGAAPSILYYQPANTGMHRWFVNGPGPGDFVALKLFYSTSLTSTNYAQVSVMRGFDPNFDDVAQFGQFPSAELSTQVQCTKAGITYYVTRQGSNPTAIGKSEADFPLGFFYKSLGDLDPAGGLYAPSDVKLGLGTDDQTLYAMYHSGAGTKLWRWGGRGDYFWNTADTAGTELAHTNGQDFFVYQNRWIVFSARVSSVDYIKIVQINGDESLENVGTPLVQNLGAGPVSYLGSVFGIDKSGVFRLGGLGGGPAILSDIVDDLASLTPATTYDNSELTDEVRWYLIAAQMPVRNAIEKLRPPFFFDIVEEDYSMNARKRGDRTVYPILDADLDCRAYGSEPGDPLQTQRTREQELPRTVSMAYIDVDLDWQTGVQSSPRQTSESQYDVTLETPVGFSAQEAAQKCWTIQVGAWTERETFKWTASRKYSYVTPCTLVKVRGRIIRVTKVTESPITGILSFEGVLAAASLYTQVAPGASGSGGQGSQGGPPGGGSGGGTPPIPGDPGYRPPPAGTAFFAPFVYNLLDLPVVNQNDSPFGFYLAASRSDYEAGYWGGADLYRTYDNGETWKYLGTKTGSTVMGELRGETVGGITYDATLLNAYTGGDVTQEITVLLSFHNPFHVLTSTTEAGLDNGANMMAMASKYLPFGGYFSNQPQVWEFMQFRDAVKVGPLLYAVTGFRRGRKGSLPIAHGVEVGNTPATAGIVGGDSWVLVDTVANIPDIEENLNRAFNYKVVPYGFGLISSPAFEFTNTGQGGGGSNAGGGGGGGSTTPGGGNTTGTGSFDTIALNFPITVNIQTGTAYTLTLTDRASLITFNNASTITVTLPTTLPKKWWCFIENVGVGNVVLDPAGSAKLDTSASSLTVPTAQGLLLVFDGTDYWTSRGISPPAFVPTELVNAQSGTSYTIVLTDRAKLVTLSNASPVAVTLPQATGSFGAGWYCDVKNLGAGLVTITPTTSTIMGATTLTLVQGNSCRIISDGTNYEVVFTPHMILLSPAYAATVTVDLALYKAYDRVQVNVGTLTGNVTFNLTNGRDGQIINATFTQDGTGSRTFTPGGNLAFSVDIPSITLTTAINKSDETAWRWHSASGKARCMAVNKGF